jgi:hypothetical protein
MVDVALRKSLGGHLGVAMNSMLNSSKANRSGTASSNSRNDRIQVSDDCESTHICHLTDRYQNQLQSRTTCMVSCHGDGEQTPSFDLCFSFECEDGYFIVAVGRESYLGRASSFSTDNKTWNGSLLYTFRCDRMIKLDRCSGCTYRLYN